MELSKALAQHKETILSQWFDVTIHSYPEDTARILAKSSNRFDNPVGNATRKSLDDTFALIQKFCADDFAELSEKEPDHPDRINGTPLIDSAAVESALDAVIRIRAVQSFAIPRALAFVFALKSIVRSLPEISVGTSFDSMIDQVALAAFNRFMKCREDIFLLRANEAKRRIHRAFERAGLVEELEEEGLSGSEKS